MGSDQKRPTISGMWSLPKPEGRYNDWGRGEWIAVSEEKQRATDQEILQLQLSPRARDLFRYARFTDSAGVEFVLFSNAQLPAPIGIEGGGIIIREILDTASDLTTAVERAYLECVRPSIRRTLQEHLDRIFGNSRFSKVLFEEEVNGKTLWLLRNDIAHGSLNVLAEAEVRFITSRVNILEDIARSYLRRIFASLVQRNYFPAIRPPMLTLPASQAIGGPGTQYMGPTDMAEYYFNVEAIASSYVRASF